MDTLSSSASTFTLPTLISPREICHLKTPTTSTLLHNPHFSSACKPTSILCSKTTCYNNTRKTSRALFVPTSQTPSLNKQSSKTVHRKAASGYAAALLDAARCNNLLEAMEKDVRRVSRLLNNKQIQSVLADPFVEENEKGEIVKEIAERGRFDKHLVVVLKLLVEKHKGLGIVKDVLMEFERMYDELSGTQVVLVPSAVKMEKQELLGIAKRVQRLSGAAKVKVRHVVDDRLIALPSFAT